MGCTTSTETGEPSKTQASRHPERGTMGRMSYKKLDEVDRARINLILDYWYDEGPADGTGGNSINYTEKMLLIRQGILEESSRQGLSSDTGPEGQQAKGVIVVGGSDA